MGYSYENNQVHEEGISFKTLLLTMRKHLVAIALSVGILTVGGFVGAKIKDSISPSYTANASIMVGYNSDSINQSAYSYSNSIAETVVSFIKDDAVLTKVASDNNTTAKALRESLTITQKSGNLIINLSYTTSSAKDSVKILNEIVDNTRATANSTVLNSSNVEEPVHPFLYKHISSLTAASEDEVVQKKSTLKYTVIGFALGVVVAFGYVFVYEMFNNSFKDKDDVEKTLGLPLLGAVPHYTIGEMEEKEGK